MNFFSNPHAGFIPASLCNQTAVEFPPAVHSLSHSFIRSLTLWPLSFSLSELPVSLQALLSGWWRQAQEGKSPLQLNTSWLSTLSAFILLPSHWWSHLIHPSTLYINASFFPSSLLFPWASYPNKLTSTTPAFKYYLLPVLWFCSVFVLPL